MFSGASFTVTLGVVSGSVGSVSFDPASLTFTSTAVVQTFRATPLTAGPVTISYTYSSQTNVEPVPTPDSMLTVLRMYSLSQFLSICELSSLVSLTRDLSLSTQLH